MTMDCVLHLCLVVTLSLMFVMSGQADGIEGKKNGPQPMVKADGHNSHEDSKDDSEPIVKACGNKNNIGTKSCDVKCECQCGFTRLKTGKCYFFSPQVRTWADALDSCQGVGATLAYPMDVVEDLVLATYLKNTFDGLTGWYLGGNELAQLGRWRWAHNNASLTYFGWTRDQPDSPGGDERCLQYFDSRWQWNNVNCDVYNSFVCQQL